MNAGDLRQQINERGWEVPDFSTQMFFERKTKYVLIIPVINEGERIRRQLEAISKASINSQIDVIVADGGSTDGSLDASFLIATGVRGLMTKTGSGKLSAQLRCAYALAVLEGYEGIVTIDGNGKDSIENIPDFIAALDRGIDYGQASRFIRGGKGINTPLSRLIAIRLIHAPVLSLFGKRWFTDTTQGYRSYSKRYLLDDRVQPFRAIFNRYELLAYLTVRAGQLGYKTQEIATKRVYPENEATPTKIGGFKAHMDLMSVLWHVAIGSYAPKGNSK